MSSKSGSKVSRVKSLSGMKSDGFAGDCSKLLIFCDTCTQSSIPVVEAEFMSDAPWSTPRSTSSRVELLSGSQSVGFRYVPCSKSIVFDTGWIPWCGWLGDKADSDVLGVESQCLLSCPITLSGSLFIES